MSAAAKPGKVTTFKRDLPMHAIHYSKEYKDQCLEIFRSNLNLYFDTSELTDFEEFLQTQTHEWPYFLVCEGKEVWACGGFSCQQGKAYLNWGMVRRSKHKEGVGGFLLLHRLKHIRELHGDIEVLLDTSQHTQHFYAKFGFMVKSVIPDGFGQGLDKVSMVYRLTSDAALT